MSTGNYDVRLGGETVPDDPSRNLLRWWTAVTILLLIAVFTEAVLAGAVLSSVGWARRAHATGAAVLLASTLTAGLVAAIALRRIPQGLKLGLTLLSLGVVVLLQAAVGALTAKGANLLWIHVPLGVALFGAAVRPVAIARGLGRQ
jgi:hypothetical protein